MRKVFSGLMVLPLLIGCSLSSNQDYYFLSHEKEKHYPVVQGMDIIAYDDTVLICDMYGSGKLVSAFDARTNRLVGQYVERGNGAEQFQFVTSMEYCPRSQTLSVYDAGLGHFGTFYVENRNGLNTKILFSKNSESKYYCVNKINGGYIATGLFPKTKFEILDDSFNIVRKSNCGYVDKPSKDIADRYHAAANYGRSFYSSKDSLLVNIIYNAGIISFYRASKDGVRQIRQYVDEPLKYKVINGNIIYLGTKGYLSVSITPKYVYALYTDERGKHDLMSLGDKIHQYDHAGRLVKKWQLDRPAAKISVDYMKGKLYTLSQGENCKILIYNLK